MHNEEKPEKLSVSRMSLQGLGLRSGMALQLRRLVEGATKTEGQLLGAVEDKGVMVGQRGPEGGDTGLSDGDICIVRGFTGQYEFSFVSKVLQTFQKPFVYALLAYPSKVDASQVRQSMRTRTSWPVTVQSATGRTVQARLEDISLQGAMIDSPELLGAIGSALSLNIMSEVEDEPNNLALNAHICHSNRSPGGDSFFVGLAFTGLRQQDKLILHYLTNAPKT
jgi:hypothetical protein